MHKILIITLLLTCSLQLTAANASKTKTEEVYEQWASRTTKELIDMGRSYLSHKNNGSVDSAVVCFSIVANRYYDKTHKQGELYDIAMATTNLGFIYNDIYYDYPRSYSYLNKAKAIAEEHHFNTLLPYIYLNSGIVNYTDAWLRGSQQLSKKALSEFTQAFRQSVKHKVWRPAIFSFINTVDVCLTKGYTQHLNNIVREYSRLSIPRNEHLQPFAHHMCLGLEHYLAGRYNEAKQEYAMMATMVESDEINESTLHLYPHFLLYKTLMAEGDHATATSEIELIRERIARCHNLSTDQVWIYELLYGHYTAIGQKAIAKDYEYDYLKAKDSLATASHINDVQQLKFISELNAINEQVAEMSLRRKKTMQMLIIVSLVSLVVISILALLLRSYRRQKTFITELYHKNMQMIAPDKQPRYQGSALEQSAKEALASKIMQVMADTDTICQADFSLTMLCERVQSNSSYVSQVINEKYDKTFKQLLNEYRVKEVCRRLSDQQRFGNMTIDAIAQSVGFRSRANFSTVFKRITGLSASEFLKAAKEKE